MTAQLHIPSHWPCAWWGHDGSTIKMACPGCGGFSMLLTRKIPTGEIASLQCDLCNLSGLDNVQAAFAPPPKRKTSP